MNTIILTRVIWLFCLLLTIAGCASNDTEAQLAIAIARDSSISKADLEKLVSSEQTPKLEMVLNKTFTLYVFAMRNLDQSNNESKKSEFEFLTSSTPKPAAIHQEVVRTGEPFTCLHVDRITDLEASVDGDNAKGTVTFLVPKLFRGSIGFVAKKIKSKWTVMEFRLPAHGIRLTQSETGTWGLEEDN